MRITAPSLLLLVAASFTVAAAKTAETPYIRIAKLASYISDAQPEGALESFDKSMPRYQAIAEQLQALATQTEVLCSIDVVEDKEATEDFASVHHLDLDWYMTLISRADNALIEKRCMRVAVTLQIFKEKSGAVWRITSLVPEKILAPIEIR